MTEFGIPFDMPQNPDNPDDYLFSAAEERMRIGAQMTDGVFPEIRLITTDATAPEQVIGNSLVVTAGEGMNVILGKGIALCGSTFYFNTAEKIIPVSEGINDIVIELNLADDKISAINQTRADGNIEDSLVRTVSRWQIALATVTVPEGTETIDFSMITDHRLNTTHCNSPDGRPVCGLVGSALQLSSNMILDEWKSIKNKFSSEWEYIKNKLDEDAAVHILNLIGNLSNLSTSTKENLVAAINEVVSTLEEHQLHLEEHDLQISDLTMKVDCLLQVGKPAENMVSFTSAGTKEWTCPEGVFKVCALIQGGGQGGYRYNVTSTSDNTYYVGIPEMSSGKAIFLENLPVTPGETYTFTVGAGGSYGGAVESGKDFGTAGSMGGASEAFGYTSEDTIHFKYQYTQSGSPKAIPNNQDLAEEYQNNALSIKGSVTNAYHTDGSYGYKNGASSKFITASKSGSSGNSGSGKAGLVMLFYD